MHGNNVQPMPQGSYTIIQNTVGDLRCSVVEGAVAVRIAYTYLTITLTQIYIAASLQQGE